MNPVGRTVRYVDPHGGTYPALVVGPEVVVEDAATESIIYDLLVFSGYLDPYSVAASPRVVLSVPARAGSGYGWEPVE